MVTVLPIERRTSNPQCFAFLMAAVVMVFIAASLLKRLCRRRHRIRLAAVSASPSLVVVLLLRLLRSS